MTGSAGNPYVATPVSLNALGNHRLETGDIVPPNPVLKDGHNWAAGMADYYKYCVTPPPPVDEEPPVKKNPRAKKNPRVRSSRRWRNRPVRNSRPPVDEEQPPVEEEQPPAVVETPVSSRRHARRPGRRPSGCSCPGAGSSRQPWHQPGLQRANGRRRNRGQHHLAGRTGRPAGCGRRGCGPAQVPYGIADGGLTPARASADSTEGVPPEPGGTPSALSQSSAPDHLTTGTRGHHGKAVRQAWRPRSPPATARMEPGPGMEPGRPRHPRLRRPGLPLAHLWRPAAPRFGHRQPRDCQRRGGERPALSVGPPSSIPWPLSRTGQAAAAAPRRPHAATATLPPPPDRPCPTRPRRCASSTRRRRSTPRSTRSNRTPPRRPAAPWCRRPPWTGTG